MSKFKYVVTICCRLLPIVSYAQEVPLDTWRTHVSFNSIHTVSIGSDKIFAGSKHGIVIFDQTDNSLSTITKIDGLSGSEITSVAADQTRDQILVSYADGDLDILKANAIINFNALKNSTTITGSKKINQVLVSGNFAYLSADYGLVVFDLNQLEVKETWRDLGSSGEKIEIYQSTFWGDSIFLATEQGVLAGDLDDNLLDFNNWRRFETGAFNGEIQSITTFNSRIYAAINGSGVHLYQNGIWSIESYLQGFSFKNLTGGNNFMFITENDYVHALNTLGTVVQLTADKIVSPFIAYEDVSGKIWIGDNENGLVSDKTGNFENYIPNGPSFSGGLRLKYDYSSNKLYAVSGGYTSSYTPLSNSFFLNSFSAGTWSTHLNFMNDDLTDIETSGSRIILSSFGEGIQVIENGVITFEDDATTPNVSALTGSPAGIWVTDYASLQPLNLLKNDNTWESFSFPAVTASQYPTEVLVDMLGNVWMVLNPANGGGILVFDKDANDSAYLTDASGAGGLPSRLVYSIAIDRDGQIWVGTDEGVAYFPNPAGVFGTGVNAVKPIFGNRFLLRDEKITAIEVDGGNRKWIGTERGVWLFNPFGEQQIHYFNTSNSPLLSDKIVDIEINDKSGEVFFITSSGMVSYRSDATSSDNAFHSVKIFPNPVTAQFNGHVGISGLSVDAFVKITDISGKLIWQTQANGGTAAWDVRDYNGRRASTGMYLVLSTSQDGTESVVGKIAVVD